MAVFCLLFNELHPFLLHSEVHFMTKKHTCYFKVPTAYAGIEKRLCTSTCVALPTLDTILVVEIMQPPPVNGPGAMCASITRTLMPEEARYHPTGNTPWHAGGPVQRGFIWVFENKLNPIKHFHLNSEERYYG